MTTSYPTDMTDEQWEILAPLLPPEKTGGRPRSVPLREIVNAIFYIVVAGCSWPMLPHDFPKWKTVYHSLTWLDKLRKPQHPPSAIFGFGDWMEHGLKVPALANNSAFQSKPPDKSPIPMSIGPVPKLPDLLNRMESVEDLNRWVVCCHFLCFQYYLMVFLEERLVNCKTKWGGLDLKFDRDR